MNSTVPSPGCSEACNAGQTRFADTSSPLDEEYVSLFIRGYIVDGLVLDGFRHVPNDAVGIIAGGRDLSETDMAQGVGRFSLDVVREGALGRFVVAGVVVSNVRPDPLSAWILIDAARGIEQEIQERDDEEREQGRAG